MKHELALKRTEGDMAAHASHVLMCGSCRVFFGLKDDDICDVEAVKKLAAVCVDMVELLSLPAGEAPPDVERNMVRP